MVGCSKGVPEKIRKSHKLIHRMINMNVQVMTVVMMRRVMKIALKQKHKKCHAQPLVGISCMVGWRLMASPQ